MRYLTLQGKRTNERKYQSFSMKSFSFFSYFTLSSCLISKQKYNQEVFLLLSYTNTTSTKQKIDENKFCWQSRLFCVCFPASQPHEKNFIGYILHKFIVLQPIYCFIRHSLFNNERKKKFYRRFYFYFDLQKINKHRKQFSRVFGCIIFCAFSSLEIVSIIVKIYMCSITSKAFIHLITLLMYSTYSMCLFVIVQLTVSTLATIECEPRIFFI